MKEKINVIMRHLLLLALLTVPAIAYAAGGTSKQINDIKRAGTCFFAESTAPSKAEAKQAATQMLSYYINDYIKDNGLSHAPVSENSIPGIKYLDMKRGANIRVFAYVERATILNGETPAPPAPEPEETPAPTAAPAPSPTPAPEHNHTPASQPQTAETTYEAAPVTYDTGDENINATTSQSNTNSDPVTRTYVTALEQLIAAGELQNALSVLNRLQAEYVVKRYGAYNSCRNKTWAFWMIYDKTGENLEGFLSPGSEGERLNIVTDAENDDLNNYMGNKDKMAVWFEFR